MPFPKNPILARFFINIGRTDILGSGVRNLYESTRIYSGGEPELVEGDVFKTIVPLDISMGIVSDKTPVVDKVVDNMVDKMTAVDKMVDNASDNMPVVDNMDDKVVDNVSDKTNANIHVKMILSYIDTHGEINATTVATLIDRSPTTVRRILSRLIDEGVVVAVGANRNRTYKKTSPS